MKTLDLITAGEAMLRLSPPPGGLLADTPQLCVYAGGTECNVAVAVAQMGYRARWLSRLSDNPLGRRVARETAGYGVDCSEIVWTSEDRVGTYYLEHGAAPRPTRVIYDRAHSAASKMGPDTFNLAQLAQARILHLTGITPALSESCYALGARMLEHARKHGLTVVFDVNFRALLWSPEVCAARLAPLLEQVDVLICTRQDAATVFDLHGEPAHVLNALQARFGARRVVVTLGKAGAIALENEIMRIADGYSVQIVDRIGAGDAFAAGIICGLLEEDFWLGLRYGVAMSALQLTLRGDQLRLSRAEVLRLMEEGAPTRPVR
jgi:2-dehydro-3-deoxygluconokinase